MNLLNSDGSMCFLKKAWENGAGAWNSDLLTCNEEERPPEPMPLLPSNLSK